MGVASAHAMSQARVIHLIVGLFIWAHPLLEVAGLHVHHLLPPLVPRLYSYHTYHGARAMAQGTWPHVCQYNQDKNGCNQVYMPIGGPPLSEVAGSCASFDARSSIHGMTAVSQGNTTSLMQVSAQACTAMDTVGSNDGHGTCQHDPQRAMVTWWPWLPAI